MRAIDSENLYKFLTDQRVKERGAYSKGLNTGLDIARSALRNEQIAPTLTPPNETPPCYQPDGDGCAYQCYDGQDEPIDKCKECPLCYSDKQRQHTPPNKPLTCGLVDRHGAPLRALDTVAADKFFVYAVRYGSHNVNPDNCAPAYQVGWYLEIMWAYPGFEDSVGHTEPLYDIDGTAARYPAHCADTADGLYNLKLEVCCRPPEGEADD